MFRFAWKGTTLVELMIATAIFGFLTMLLLGVLNFGTKTWRNVESRSAVETELRNAVMDMNKEIRATMMKSVVADVCTTYAASDGPIFYVCFASLTRDADSDDLRLWDDINKVTYDQGDNEVEYYNRWILYYAIRPDNHDSKFGSCNADSPGSTSYYYCPHKILIKKELFADKPPSGYSERYKKNNAINDLYMDKNNIDKHITRWEAMGQIVSGTEGGNYDSVKSVKVLARNVLVFTTNFSAPEIQYTLRCFKTLEYGKVKGTTQDLYNLSPVFSVQIDSKTIPLMDEGGTLLQL